jgi:hypothetical protein
LQGVLAQAKNGDELFGQENSRAANGKAIACTQGALLFIPLSFGGKGFFNFFSFFPGSQCVLFKFAMGSKNGLPNRGC